MTLAAAASLRVLASGVPLTSALSLHAVLHYSYSQQLDLVHNSLLAPLAGPTEPNP